jgi:spore germination protein KB
MVIFLVEKGKIDSTQAILLNITMIFATALLSVPAITATHARQDAWLSSLLATLLALPVAWLTAKLASLFPGKILSEYPEAILGRWAGKILGLLYLLWFIQICSIMVREFGDFMVNAFIPETPIVVVNIIAIAIAAYIITQGLEVMARVNQVFLPLILFSIVLIFVLATPEMDLRRLLPVWESGAMHIFKGALAPLAWYGEISTFAMIVPFLVRPGEARRIALISVVAVGLIFAFLVVGSLAVFGPGIAAMAYPVLNITRVINIANVIERMDPFIVAVWITGGYIKIAFFYYVIVLGSARWLKLCDFRPLVLPVGVILAALSIMAGDNSLEIFHFIGDVWPFYALFTFEIAIPLGLLVIALFTGRGKDKP